MSDGYVLEWDGIRDVVESGLRVWTSGSELAWGEYVWEALTRTGLTSYLGREERVECVLRALTLVALYRDFCSRAFEEGELGEWRERIDAHDLLEAELVDEFSLGRLAERDGVFPDEVGDDGPSLSKVVAELAQQRYREVVRALVKQLGTSALFASLWQARQADVSYPLGNEVAGDIVNSTTADKMVAWEWLTEEF